jgi:hypothetical protein
MPEAIDKLDWASLSANEREIHILEHNIDKLDWFWVSTNPSAIKLLERYPDKIDWSGLHLNPEAFCLFEKNIDKVDWIYISCNFMPNKTTEKLIIEYIDKINWLYRDLAIGYHIYSPVTSYIINKIYERVNCYY